jgi:hypothetical protein
MNSWILLVIFFLHTTAAFADDWLIIPGKSVGVITAQSTTRDLIHAYGAQNVRSSQRCFVLDALSFPCILLFENSPQQIRILLTEPRSVEIQGDERWHTAEGIHIGTTVKELEELNGTQFEFLDFNVCGQIGYITSWRNGKLSHTGEPPNILFFLSNVKENPDYPINPRSNILPRNSRITSIRVSLQKSEN